MTKNSKLTRLVRERMRYTGEKYMTARKFVTRDTKPLSQAGEFKLSDLLLDDSQVALLKHAASKPGLVVFSGGAGAGKTTTTAALLKELLESGSRVEAFERSENSELGLLTSQENLSVTFAMSLDYDPGAPDWVPVFFTYYDTAVERGSVADVDAVYYDDIRYGEDADRVLKKLVNKKPIITSIHSSPHKPDRLLTPIHDLVRLNSLWFPNQPGSVLETVNAVVVTHRLDNLVHVADPLFADHRFSVVYPVDETIRGLFKDADAFHDRSTVDAVLEHYRELGVPLVDDVVAPFQELAVKRFMS
jgi:hypothetical protein